MKKLIIICSFTLNFVIICGGFIFLYEKKILHKALRVIFYEGRVPYVTPSYAMNRYYETRKALFKVQRDFDRPVLLLGDGHTAIPDWAALLGAPQIAARGIEGDTTIGLIARLRDYNDINAKNVVIWIGTNDVMQGGEANGVAKRIIEAARAKADVLKKSFTTESTEDTTEQRGRCEVEQPQVGPKGEEAGVTESKDEAGMRLAGEAGVAFSNPSTSGLARDSENSLRTRFASGAASALDSGHSTLDLAPEAPNVFVLGIPPMATWVERGMERNATIREINARLAEGVDENGYRFIELESVLADENGFLRRDMTSDGVHLSAKGYVAVLEKMKTNGVMIDIDRQNH